MQQLKNISFLFILMLSLSNCASTQKSQDKMSLEIGDVYYENTDLGYHIFIPIENNNNNIILNNVYFKGKEAKLEEVSENLFLGRFNTKMAMSQDIIMSSDPNAEYGNKAPIRLEKIPFKLNNDECMLSYIEADKVNYFKVKGIIEK